jgi:hypothetical protein
VRTDVSHFELDLEGKRAEGEGRAGHLAPVGEQRLGLHLLVAGDDQLDARQRVRQHVHPLVQRNARAREEPVAATTHEWPRLVRGLGEGVRAYLPSAEESVWHPTLPPPTSTARMAMRSCIEEKETRHTHHTHTHTHTPRKRE